MIPVITLSGLMATTEGINDAPDTPAMFNSPMDAVVMYIGEEAEIAETKPMTRPDRC